MLQADSTVATIDVSSVGLSSWKKDPSSYSNHYLYSISDTKLPIQPTINFNTLQNLSALPALLPIDTVMKILHAKDASVIKALIDAKSLTATQDGQYVMASSLTKYIAP